MLTDPFNFAEIDLEPFLDNGARTLLAGTESSGGPPLIAPYSLVLDARAHASATDAIRSAVLVVDGTSGGRVLRSK